MFEEEYIVIDVADALARASGTDVTDSVVRIIAGSAASYSRRATREVLAADQAPTLADLRAHAITALAHLRSTIARAISIIHERAGTQAESEPVPLPAFTITEFKHGEQTRLIGLFTSDVAAEHAAQTLRDRRSRAVYAYSVTEIENPDDVEDPT